MGLLEQSRRVLGRSIAQVEACAQADPGDSLRAFVLELELARLELDGSSARFRHTLEGLRRARRLNERNISQLEAAIRDALAEESDRSARLAIRRKRELCEADRTLAEQMEGVCAELTQIDAGLRQLEQKIAEAKAHRRRLRHVPEPTPPIAAVTRAAAADRALQPELELSED